MEPSLPAVSTGPREFATTHWSVIRKAGSDRGAEATAALETLCRAYWLPLYAFVRRSGYSQEDAQDLTQEFFSRLLSRNWLPQADPAQGRFRSYLIGALKNFLANEWHRANAQRRGGGTVPIAIDALDADQRVKLEPRHSETPDRAYERQWAETLIDRVMERLAAEHDRHPIGWPVLRRFVVESRNEVNLLETAAAAGVTEAALRSVVHRLRRRYQELVREEIAHTVATPGEVDEELRHLIELLGT